MGDDAARAGPPMSRAGLWWELNRIVEEILEEMRQAQRRAQTGLRRRVRRNLLKTLGAICRNRAELEHDWAMSLTGLDRQGRDTLEGRALVVGHRH
jgi:hypothetical protein